MLLKKNEYKKHKNHDLMDSILIQLHKSAHNLFMWLFLSLPQQNDTSKMKNADYRHSFLKVIVNKNQSTQDTLADG
jgi:hypothetical protein